MFKSEPTDSNREDRKNESRFGATVEPVNIHALLARVAMSTLAVKVGSVGLAFGLNIVIARLLGSQQYGDYVLVISWISILALLATSGMDGAALRFVAEYLGQKKWSLLRGFILRGGKWVFSTSFSITLVLGVCIYFFQSFFRETLVEVFFVGSALILVSSMLAFFAACLQGLNSAYVALAQSTQLLRVLLLGAFVIGLMAIAPDQLGPVVLMGLNLAAVTIVLGMFAAFFNMRLSKQISEAEIMLDNRQWFATALPILIISGSQYILAQCDTLMVGIFMGAENAGFYTVASRIAILATFGIASINAVVAPMIARSFSQNRLRELQRIVTYAAKGAFLFSLSASIFLFIFGKTILGFFGPEFTIAFLPLTILLVGQLVDSLAGSVGYLMTMTGHQREMMYIVGGCAVLNVVLNTIMIPAFGLSGAAIVTTMTIALWNLILIRRVKVNLGINSTILRLSGS